MKELIDELIQNTDEEYQAFHSSLFPSLDSETILGVRTPILRKLAKKYSKHPDINTFLNDLPHRYYDENQIHFFIISEIKDFDQCVKEVDRFLPYVDNWAVCDQSSPKVFKNNHKKLLPVIKKWVASPHLYTCRFGIRMFMNEFLEEDFKPEYLELISKIRSDEYYLKMMISWYFATALAFQYEATIPYLEKQILPLWIHNKTIQKARESFRISKEQKEYLKTLKK